MVANKPKVPSNCTFRYFFFLCFWLLTLLKTCSIKHASFSNQFSSVAQSCPTICDPMDCSTPGSSVHHQLAELAQTHVHQISDAISFSVIPFSSHLQTFPASGTFQMSQFFAWGGQSIGASASASSSVFPMNIQDWFPLGWTDWISLQSKGLSRVFNTTGQKDQLLGAQPFL